MYKLEDTILLEERVSSWGKHWKFIWNNPTKSQLKAKGIKSDISELKELPNIIKHVRVKDSSGSMGRNVTMILSGDLCGVEIEFELTGKEFIELMRTTDYINNQFQTDFRVIFEKTTAKFVPINSDMFVTAMKEIAGSESKNEQLKQKTKELKEQTRKKFENLEENEIVEINNKVYVYLGHKEFGYCRWNNTKKELNNYAKKGYGLYELGKTSEWSKEELKSVCAKGELSVEYLDNIRFNLIETCEYEVKRLNVSFDIVKWAKNKVDIYASPSEYTYKIKKLVEGLYPKAHFIQRASSMVYYNVLLLTVVGDNKKEVLEKLYNAMENRAPYVEKHFKIRTKM